MKSTVAALGLTMLAFSANSFAQAPDWKKIRLGVEGAYPPFSQVGPDGKLTGFDIDIAEALCAEMKAECTLIQQDFDGLIPSLNARKFDAIVASMSITEERKKSVDFSDKYYKTPARLVTKKGANFSAPPNGLKGKTIGVQRSTIHDRFATEQMKVAKVKRYTKQDDAFLDLAAGRIDASLVDIIAAETGFLKTTAGKGFEFFGPVYDDPKYFGVGAGIAVRKADTSLRDKLNNAIKAIRANGTYKKIQDKYFNFDVYGSEEIKK